MDEKPLLETQNLLTPRPGRKSQHDRETVRFIQSYGLSVIRCHLLGENPILGLLALMPFRLGEFCLASELHTLLFASQSERIGQEHINFTNRLEEIINSIVKFHQNRNNDAYITQTACGLQILVYAAIALLKVKGDDVTNANKNFLDLISKKLDLLQSLSSDSADVVQATDSILFLTANLVPDKYSLSHSLKYTPYSPTPIDPLTETELDKEDKKDQKAENLVEIDNAVHTAFGESYAAAEADDFNTAYEKLNLGLSTAKDKHNILNTYFTGYAHHLKNILNYLKTPNNVTTEKQIFALTTLHKILAQEPQNAHLITNNSKGPLEYLLMQCSPKDPKSLLLLGKIFVQLVSSGETHSLLSSLFFINQRQSANRNSIVKKQNALKVGLFAAIAITIALTVLAATLFPLLPLYITAAILGAVSIGGGIYLWKQKTPEETVAKMTTPFIQKITSPEQAGKIKKIPMIQTSLATWLDAHGYDLNSLPRSGYKFIELFQTFPNLVDDINVERDARIFIQFFRHEKNIISSWKKIEALAKAFEPQQYKIAYLMMHDANAFKSLVIDQLSNLAKLEYLYNLETRPSEKTKFQNKLWEIIREPDCLKKLLGFDEIKAKKEILVPLQGTAYAPLLGTTSYSETPLNTLKRLFPNHQNEIEAAAGKKAEPSKIPPPKKITKQPKVTPKVFTQETTQTTEKEAEESLLSSKSEKTQSDNKPG